MTFNSPAAFVWAFLAVPILLFYAWAIRAPRYRVSTGALWEQVLAPDQSRSRWRQPASLCVQLLILLTLVAALAEPRWQPAARNGDVNQAGDALGVTRWVARRDPSDPVRCQVLVEVTSWSRREADCCLEFALDGKPIGRGEAHLTPGGRWRQVYQFTSAAGGQLTVRLDRPDDGKGDVSANAAGPVLPRIVQQAHLVRDSASLLLPPCKTQRVVLVDGEKGWLRRALESNPRVQLSVADAPPAALEPDVLLVLNGADAQRLPDGHVLVVNPLGPSPWWKLGDALSDAEVAGQDEKSPLLAHVRLLGLRLSGSRRIVLTDKARPLARALAWTAEGEPLLCEIARETGSLVLLSGSVEAGDLAGHAALPVLLANAVGRVSQPDFFVPLSPGEWNRPADASSLANEAASAPAGTALWLWLAAAALAMLVCEWCLYQRRWIC